METTSGNTGIGLAAIAATKGYRFRVYIQDQVSQERYQVIHAFGGETIKLSEEPAIAKVLEETGGDFVAAIKALREEVLSKEKDIFFVDQVSNPANPAIHEATTGPEIWEDTEGKVDIFVANVGTGGTVSGTGRYLKSKNPGIQIIAIQPGENSLPSEENPDRKKSQVCIRLRGFRWREFRKLWIYKSMMKNLKWRRLKHTGLPEKWQKQHGILIGTSSGAAIHAATQLAKRPENEGKTIVAVLPDTGLRYLSTNLFNEEFLV